MNILDWKQCRTKLLEGMATIDRSIADRAIDLESSWNNSAVETYDDSNPHLAEVQDMASAVTDENEASQQGPEAPEIEPPVIEVPEYLR